MTKQEAYDLMPAFMQDYIYKKKWNSLNALQLSAMEEILKGKHNLLFMAGTAQGKTEAAFLPAITVISAEKKSYEQRGEEEYSGIGILYISPLKALINDQFLRIEEMLKESDIPLTKWHGDASTYKKDKLKENPQGILQMTPESLEAMLCLHGEQIPLFFHNLQFIIIDELHYFIQEQRGIQLLSLLERMQNRAGCMPVRIGLSATIQNKERAIAYLNTGSQFPGKVLSYQGEKHQVMCSVTVTGIPKEEILARYYKKIIKHTREKRCLLFTNSRRQCEMIIAGLKKVAKENQLPDIYHVHHGSISRGSREDTENLIKKEEGPILTGTTLTLELGIDIGDLDEVIQAADPISIASMVQRLGRSGRRNGKSAISFHLQYRDDHNDAKKLDLQLIRSIAMIELYFRELYMEEQKMPGYPFRFLAHSVLSVLCEKGCLQAAKLAKSLLELGVFQNISQTQLKELLYFMMEKHMILQYDDGAIGLDDAGEKLVGNMDFFAVFDSGESMAVYYMGAEIGQVDRSYSPGSYFYLGGVTWQVLECDMQSKKIVVDKAEGEGDIRFTGYAMMETDQKIMGKIHEILRSDQTYAYLDDEAKAILGLLRDKAKRYAYVEERGKDPKNNTAYLWCPCLSTQAISTLFHAFRAHDIHCERIYCKELLYGIRFFHCDEKRFLKICQDMEKEKVLIDHAYVTHNLKYQGKYFDLLPDALKAKEILEDLLDQKAAREALRMLRQ